MAILKHKENGSWVEVPLGVSNGLEARATEPTNPMTTVWVDTSGENAVKVKNGNNWDRYPLEIYSTTEQRVGTWIDGKPLYRKTLVTTDLGVSDGKTVSNTLVSNVDFPVSLNGHLSATTDMTPLYPCPWFNNNNTHRAYASYIKDTGIYWYSTYGFTFGIFTLEYTKTTD